MIVKVHTNSAWKARKPHSWITLQAQARREAPASNFFWIANLVQFLCDLLRQYDNIIIIINLFGNEGQNIYITIYKKYTIIIYEGSV